MSKEKIFALLSAQAGDFVSGEDISAQLGISRAAVWKAVGALRRDGYTIEAQTGLATAGGFAGRAQRARAAPPPRRDENSRAHT